MASRTRFTTTLAPLAAGLLAVSLAGCGAEPPLQPEPSAFGAARGPSGGFPVVLLGRGNGPNSAATLQEAVEKVASGGTIRVFDGTHEASGVVVDKPLNVVAAGSGTPVIRIVPGEGDRAGIEVVDVAGTVAFRGLLVQNDGTGGFISVLASGTERLSLAEMEFELGAEAEGVNVFGTGAGERVEVSGGAFRGGVGGVLGSAVRVEIEGTSFAGQSRMAVYGYRAASVSVVGADFAGCGQYCIVAAGIATPAGVVTYGELTVRDVDAVDCGAFSCVYAVNGVDVSITGNRLANAAITGEDVETLHNLVFLWLSRGEVSDNVIDGCGRGQCIAVSGSSDADVVGNRITAYGEQGTRVGIVVSDGFRGPSRASAARVVDNVVTGVGSNDANVEGHAVGCFGEYCGLVTVEGGSTAEVSGNELSNGNIGIYARDGGSITGRDNRVSDVRRGVAVLDAGSSAALRFNDVTGATFLDLEESHAGGSDLTCNWWGSAAGPDAAASAQGPSLYTPWATAPVAGTGATTCAGS